MIQTKIDLKKIISKASSIAIISHVRPDGDTLGAALSLYQIVESLGKEASLLCESPVPKSFGFVDGVDKFLQVDHKKYDLAFAVDCAGIDRLGIFKKLFLNARSTVNIDHHFSNDNFAEYNVLNKKACSTCQVLFELYKEQFELTKGIAQCLYIGLSTDTGHFMHSNVTSSIFLIAAELANTGIDIENIARRLYKQNSKERLKLLAFCLATMQYFDNDKIALMVLTNADLESFGSNIDDTEGLVGYCINQASVDIGAMLTQYGQNAFKVSMRSKVGIDVSQAAAVFGGGGHKQASGCMIYGDKQYVIDKLIEALSDCL